MGKTRDLLKKIRDTKGTFHCSPLIPKMLMFFLAISCLTMSNLSWFMDLIFQVPMQYCSLQYQTLLPWLVTSTTGHCFFLCLCLFILSGAISPLFSSSIFGTYWLGATSFSVISFCLFILSWGSQAKNTEVVCHSLLQWCTFCQTLHLDPFFLGGPTWHSS